MDSVALSFGRPLAPESLAESSLRRRGKSVGEVSRWLEEVAGSSARCSYRKGSGELPA